MTAVAYHSRLYTPTNIRTYLWALLFVVGNVAVPYALHTIDPRLGQVWLPIYFFTLLGALRFGTGVGVLTAILSPMVSYQLTGMPPMPILSYVLLKSIILALTAGLVAQAVPKKWLPLVPVTAVVLMQVIGNGIMYIANDQLPAIVRQTMALRDVQSGYPGLILQIVLVTLLTYFTTRNADQAAR